METTRSSIGAYGENLAAAHLEQRGYQLLARNWRVAGGEIDIVAQDPYGELAVVEVKTRRTATFGTPLEAVSGAKYARLRRLAAAWLAAHPHEGDIRIDVVSVLLPPGGEPHIEHLRGIEP